ncbi:Carboxypeptidase G2 precursor [Legionella massiliensis]|uniref:Carboxypeptidase G2 n=1 Tax=Legionella massiliensis TaxID=1034943 RepID=A0A078KXY1_9GAMM|nr:M20/M25/M40 family metallo-hydrolase [Legionella massiliensis]CDZ76604.1 Carboxypeptidase G2 precursor [Legionella massiliensis]CEE12342.1 Carboxypeptidase G2 precursor [Legionella massiliensis]
MQIERKLRPLFFLGASLLFSPTLKATEQPYVAQISHFVSSHQQEQLSLLEKLVNINSGTSNLSGVHQVGELLRPQFEALGFKVRWQEEPAEMHRAGTLIAEHPGRKGTRLLLIGHLDTVFPADGAFQRFEQQGNYASGPGIIDDKGGDLVILYALKALQAIDALADANITVILTGDEEDSGKPTSISRKPLFAAAEQSDIALDFEWAFTKDTATIARRGISSWEIKTEGNEAHSSQIFQPEIGYGAIYELVRILDTVRKQLSQERYLSINPGIILGGTDLNYDEKNAHGLAFGKGNVIAKSALAKGDLRFLSKEQEDKAKGAMSTIVNSHLAGTKATIAFQAGIPAMPPASENLTLLKKYSQASVALGYGEVKALDPGVRGAGDISFIAARMSASLAGLGPIGTGAHSDKETLDIQSLGMQTQRAALVMYWLINEKRKENS